MRFLRRSLTGVFLLSLTAGLLVLAAVMVFDAIEAARSDAPADRDTQERVFAARLVAVAPETVAPVLTTYGEIRSRRTLELRAGTGGTVVELAPEVEEGGFVERGQLVARIDPADAQAAVDLARADLAEAEAERREAARALELSREDLAAAEAQAALRNRALERQRDLGERGVGTAATTETAELAAAAADQAVVARRQALAEAEARIARSATGLDRRRIALAEAGRTLDETEIRAEFSGVLADVAVVEGGLVTQNERLARLIDPDALEVAFRVSTPQYARLLGPDGALVGGPVMASLDVLGVAITGRGTITRESGIVGAGQTGRLIYARLDEAPGFRPGDFVTVAVEEPPLGGVARLPAAAVSGAGTVLALGPEDRLEEAPVEVLRRQGDDVLVAAGALAGREVVAERTPLLGAGIKVRPAREGAASAGETAEMLELSAERRARLVAFVEGSAGMPDAAKARVLAQLREPRVPARVVARIEQRMGG